MKKSLLTIGLAIVAASLSFAAPQAAGKSTAPTTATQPTKKHVKKTHKVKKQAATTNVPAAKPASK